MTDNLSPAGAGDPPDEADETKLEIEAAFRKLSLSPEMVWKLPSIVQMLSFIPRGEKGTPPDNFREVGKKAARKQLDTVADLSERLAAAINDLSQTSIVALADTGLLQLIHHRQLANLLESVAGFARAAELSDVAENQGRGRPPNNLASGVANILATNYAALTGKQPAVSTKNNGRQDIPYGQYFNLVTDVFSALKIDASPEAAARKAEKQFKERTTHK
jgi:hypothetical protein